MVDDDNPDPFSAIENLIAGTLRTIDQSGADQAKEAHAVAVQSEASAENGNGFEAIPFEKVVAFPPAANPSLAKGIELAKFPAGVKFQNLVPPNIASLRELEKEEEVGFRRTDQKSFLSPGENIYSKAGHGIETYFAKCKGRLVLVGTTFHILPSDMDGKIQIRIGTDNLAAWMTLQPSFGSGRMPDARGVALLLKQSRIAHGINVRAIRDTLLACARSGRRVPEFLVAKGSRIVPGKAGSVEFYFDLTPQEPAGAADDSIGKIDYHQAKRIPTVAKNQLLAKVEFPIQGVDGINIFGKPIPAPIIPEIKMQAGANVRMEQDNTLYFSEVNGCAQLNGNTLDVMDLFVINSDVDYHTGDIRFPGNVLVTGSVQRGFSIEAEGDVTILKFAEPCRIKAGRDVLIKGGIMGDGKGKCKIEAGRNIKVGYAENAWLEAQGDVTLGDYAMQSFIYCCGRLLLDKKKGAIIGGEAMSDQGIEAKSFGSSACVKTSIVAGVNFVVNRKLSALENNRSELKSTIAKVDDFLVSLLDTAKTGSPQAGREANLKAIEAKRQLMAKALHILEIQITALGAIKSENRNVIVKAVEVVNPEVVIRIGNRSRKILQIMYRTVFLHDPKKDEIVCKAA
jgi:uncharacterized protein (DUF342 family)